MFQRRILVWGLLLFSLGNSVGASPQNSDSQRQVFDATAKPSAPGQRGPYYALLIGINDYRYLTKLRTAVDDAGELAKTLREQYGFETAVLPNATRNDIIVALDNYRRTLPEDANLLIYYAGHGWYDPDMEKAYWAPVEAQQGTYADWIISDEITSRTRAIPARHILVISDSCYSGMIAAAREASPDMTPVRRSAYLDKMLSKKSRGVISSGGNEPVADAGAPGHSVFAYALLEGLKQIEWDAFSANDLFSQFVRVQVAGKSEQVPQYSVIRNSGDDFGDFVFFRTPGPKRTPAVEAGLAGVANASPPASRVRQATNAEIDAFMHSDLKGDAPPSGAELPIDERPETSSPLGRIQMEFLGEFSGSGPGREVSSVAFSPTDRRLLASASALGNFKGNGSIGLWDLTSGEATRAFQNSGDNPQDQYETVAYSPDGKLIGVTTVGMRQKAVLQLWEVSTGALKQTLGAGELELPNEAVAFSPDSRMVAAGSGDGTVWVYNTDTGMLIKSLKHPGVIASLAFSKDGRVLAVGDRDWRPSVRLWDVGTWTKARDLSPPQPSYGEALAFSPDGKTLATGHAKGGVYTWDYRTGARLQTMRNKDSDDGQSRTLVFSPDGRFLTFVTNHRLQLWDPATGKLLGDFDVDAKSLTLHPNGLLLATVPNGTHNASGDWVGARSIQIWKLRY